jgi:steroid Delta-isomerase
MPTTPTAMPTRTETSPIERTIHAYFAATRAMDRDAWVRCFAPDGCSHDPVGAPPTKGHAALGAFFDSIAGLASSIGLMEEHIYVCGDQAAIKWIGRGTGKANGKPFLFEGIDVMHFDAQGRIREIQAFWDPQQLFAQLA